MSIQAKMELPRKARTCTCMRFDRRKNQAMLACYTKMPNYNDRGAPRIPGILNVQDNQTHSIWCLKYDQINMGVIKLLVLRIADDIPVGSCKGKRW